MPNSIDVARIREHLDLAIKQLQKFEVDASVEVRTVGAEHKGRYGGTRSYSVHVHSSKDLQRLFGSACVTTANEDPADPTGENVMVMSVKSEDILFYSLLWD